MASGRALPRPPLFRSKHSRGPGLPVVDADIHGFFDAIDRKRLIQLIQHRIEDKRVVRLLQQWLHAGVMEAGQLTHGETGTAQGAAISRLLANVYLHFALDLWAQQWRKRHATGNVIIVRYADDFVVGFEQYEDGLHFRRELADRLGEFKLELHPDKTRLIAFGRYATDRRQRRGRGKPETFTFFGLKHICGKAKNGWFQLYRHTAKARLRAKLQVIREECMKRRHQPFVEQGRWLR